jgi:Protein of unknown function (DUF2569)
MNHNTEPSGLGGWLILPMLALIILPFKIGAMLMSIYFPIFSKGYWEVLTTPGSEVYHVLWAPLLMFEIVGNCLFLLASIVLLILFFQKNHRFPKLMILFLAANVVFVVIDFFAADLIPAVADEPDPESNKELMRVIAGAAIWIPYFLKSVRVKNTFVKRLVEQGATANP